MRSLSRVGPPRRWLIVVAENEPVLHQGLRLTFSNDPTVELVVDRRGRESVPRLPAGETPPGRRQPPSPDQSAAGRDLNIPLLGPWEGMTVYGIAGPQKLPVNA